MKRSVIYGDGQRPLTTQHDNNEQTHNTARDDADKPDTGPREQTEKREQDRRGHRDDEGRTERKPTQLNIQAPQEEWRGQNEKEQEEWGDDWRKEKRRREERWREERQEDSWREERRRAEREDRRKEERRREEREDDRRKDRWREGRRGDREDDETERKRMQRSERFGLERSSSDRWRDGERRSVRQSSFIPDEVESFHDKVVRKPKGKAISLTNPSSAKPNNFTWPDNQPNKHLKFAYERHVYEGEFTLNNRILPDDAPRSTYRRRNNDGKSLIHWGQRKLLFSEIEFLTLYGHLSTIVVYAGAAPGTHIQTLSDMFPDHKFHLYDPNSFDPVLSIAKYAGKIEVFQEYFMDDTASKYAGQGVLFISDIRTANWQKMTEEDVQNRVREDNKWMLSWVLLMKPKKAMLKFKVPYPEKPKTKTEVEDWLMDRGVDRSVIDTLRESGITPIRLRACTQETLKQYNITEQQQNKLWENITILQKEGTTQFLKGDVHLPIFGPVTTTETRLVTDAEQPIITWDHTDYEELLFHFNTVTRMTYYPHRYPTDRETGFDHCYDCRSEIWVLETYLTKCKGILPDSPELKREVILLSLRISKDLGHSLDSYVHRVYD